MFVSYFMVFSFASIASCPHLITAQSADQNIGLGSTLTGTQTLRSSNGSFEFGLFSQNDSSSGKSSTYLGIWYTNITPQTVVWAANRNTPVTDGRPSFGLSVDGDLQVLDSAARVVWSSQTKGQNVSALVLKESGNLVLEDNNATPVWESFRHPGNTWLPTMTLGPGMKLKSWLSSTNPQEGPFALQMRPATREFVSVWNDSKQYWTSGSWDGKIFANEPEMTTNYIYNFSYNSSGFTWYTYPAFASTFISRFVMETDGEITQYTWTSLQPKWSPFWFRPTNPCDAYALCGPNGVCNSGSSPFCSCPTGFEAVDTQMWASHAWTSGCKRSLPLNCSKSGSNDAFTLLNDTSFDGNYSHSFTELDESNCKSGCLENCSCLAYYYEGEGSCELYHDVLVNGKVSSVSGAVRLRISKLSSRSITDVSTPTGKTTIMSSGAIVAIVCGSAVGIILIVGVVFLYHKRISAAHRSREYIPGVLQMFSYVELQHATKNFTDKLGSGGFGTVFKGTLSSKNHESSIAAKKLERHDQGEKQFRTEVSTVGKIQHVNLVRLAGFCSEGTHRLLVYEYMPNGSLDAWLFRKSNATSIKTKAVLDWSTRYKIALGTARGIAYLHEECRDCIIHCDIKPENILLDEAFCAKVSDFGLAKLVGREFSRVLTTTRGTRGYLAPEWLAGLPITAKADVYSFGMTLLEVISGRRNIDAREEDVEKMFYPVWAAQQVRAGNIVGLADERLGGKVVEEEVRRCAYVGVWCIQEEEEMRPSMGMVVQVLEGSLEMEAPPIPTSLQALALDPL